MGWRLQIRHSSGFRYAGAVRSSYNEVRLTPLTLATQTTLESRVEVLPATPTSGYWDYWGTRVTYFDLQEPHDQLEVVGTSVVETMPPRPARPSASWGDLADARVLDRYVDMLATTTRTAIGGRLAETARGLVKRTDPHGGALAIAGWVRDTVAYVPGSTGVQTSAQEAYVQRSGVCQDIAHLTVGMLRSVGIPARYVSGYLHPVREAEVGESSAGQSHAWVEWWVGEWAGFDPTNGLPAGEHHVVVARGRDYADVAPLKGIYHGPSSTSLGVEVEVTRLA